VRDISSRLNATVVDSWAEFRDDPGAVYLRSGDSSHTDLPDNSVDLVVTDPPYMDNVHYSELADFFHAWLSELRPHDTYPSSASTTRDAREVQSPSPSEFEEAIAGVWRECSRVLKADGLVAFTFHQARVSGWAALVTALASADLVITAVQPVKGEMSTSTTKYGKEPSNLDAIVICRKSSTIRDPPLDDPHYAAALGERRLAGLRSAGIQVGVGDVRSVIRGHVLATYTSHPEPTALGALVALADDLSAEAVSHAASV
jgi:adenine-specific DNA methylase